jgi:HSP20 family molecular chaperone IbpA
MAIKDLIPWNNPSRDVGIVRRPDAHPFPALHREMNLSISGEKKSESEDKDRRFSERYYGRFERRIPLQDVDEDKASASFRNGVLTITVPKSSEARDNVRRIAINRNS